MLMIKKKEIFNSFFKFNYKLIAQKYIAFLLYLQRATLHFSFNQLGNTKNSKQTDEDEHDI
jgi:hypothetical protein